MTCTYVLTQTQVSVESYQIISRLKYLVTSLRLNFVIEFGTVKIRLYSYATGQLYVGLYPYLKDWCKKKDVHIVESSEILAYNNGMV